MAKHQDASDHAADEPKPQMPNAGAAAAVALGRGAGKLAPEAAEFLRKSAALLDLQMEHLHEERDIHHRHQQLRYFGDRLRVALQLLAVAGGAVVAIAFAAIAWSARTDRSLVVEAFSAPPELAQHGVNGRLLANLLLDRLNAMEARAQSVRAPASYVDSWTGESRVEIPETGISLTELDRLLHRWLGHQTHISGDAYFSGAELVIAARMSDKPAQQFAGQPGDVEALVDKTAEAVYAQTQPYRYATFLNRSERLAEAQTAFRRLAEGAAFPANERAWGYTGFGSSLYFDGDVVGAEQQERKALHLKPDLALAHHYLALGETALGHEESALSEAREARRFYAQRGGDTNAIGSAYLGRRLLALMAETTGDYAGAAKLAAALEGSPDYSAGARVTPCRTIEDLARAHDLAGARGRSAEWAIADDAAMPIAAKAGIVCLPAWALARATGDWTSGLTDLIAADKAAEALGAPFATLRLTALTPWLAYARMKTGDVAGAQASIAATPLDCYLCLRVRGSIAETAKDHAAADAWFARAVQAAPTLPFAYLDRGEALLGRGDLPTAAAQFAKAHELSPNFAEPSQAWGEVLARQGDRDGAAAKFRLAAAAAPRWARPHLLLAQTLAALGQSAEAARQAQLAKALS